MAPRLLIGLLGVADETAPDGAKCGGLALESRGPFNTDVFIRPLLADIRQRLKSAQRRVCRAVGVTLVIPLPSLQSMNWIAVIIGELLVESMCDIGFSFIDG
ncbi:hypothetical protein KUV51_18780 [Tateyamaria omphalii]|uniref:hypothetical protein n=1 Tax=Tateyamaria omphalii TaxID=299262 RepID=UPI001C99B49B|nr:hypothetical protein [Tateyamaria omphalii]MBY5935057.1 hypothetical protein [Tateyamaria omphalii]